MIEVKAIIRPQRVSDVLQALHNIPDLPGVTMSKVHAFARSRPRDGDKSEAGLEIDLCKIEMVVPEAIVDRVVGTIQVAAHTGRAGDGMIFLTEIRDAIRIRSGERGHAAL